MKRFFGLVLGAFIIFAGAAEAQTGHPGYFPIEDLGIMAQGELEVDIDLQGAMLQVAAGAMQEADAGSDADLAQLVGSLERIRLQVGTPERADQVQIANIISDAVSQLAASGWDQILRVSDDETMVYLFSLESGGAIVGLTGLVNSESDDVVLANLVGEIDPVLLGRLLSKMDDLPGFDELMDSVQD